MTPRYKIVDVLLSRSIDGPAEVVFEDTRGDDNGQVSVPREHAVNLMADIADHPGETPYVANMIQSPVSGLYVFGVTWIATPTEAFA